MIQQAVIVGYALCCPLPLFTMAFPLTVTQKVLPPRLFTVGRLDVASHGLILVTNDGHWAQKVIHPSADITKVRWSVCGGGWSGGAGPGL